MQKFIRVCPLCAKENIRKESHSKIFVPGYIDWYNDEPDDEETCITHENQKLLKSNISCEEFQVLRYISNEPSFMEVMNDLKEKDLIEYQLRLSQFKTQVQQQKGIEVQENNQVKCPKCGSTNIQIVQRKWSILTGFMTNKTDRVCVNCKNKF